MPSNNPNVLANLKPFVKGDKRINRKGRPKGFDEVRKLAVKLAGEAYSDKNGDAHQFPGKETATGRAEAILLQWSQSGDPRKQALFMEYAFGKPTQKIEQDHKSSDGSMSPKSNIDMTKLSSAALNEIINATINGE